jgi:protein-tyrosine phosphatase
MPMQIDVGIIWGLPMGHQAISPYGYKFVIARGFAQGCKLQGAQHETKPLIICRSGRNVRLCPAVRDAVRRAVVRDLGGHTTTDGKRVKWDMLYRSDALDGLTPADWSRLEAMDIARITDFRADTEVARSPDRLPPALDARRYRLALDYSPKGVAGAAGVVAAPSSSATTGNTDPLDRIDRMLLITYPRFVRETNNEYAAWLRSLLDGPADGAHLFHCTGGADRTGFAAAILLMALGVPRDQVMQDYLLTNQYLYSPRGRALLDRRTASKLPDGVQVHARYLKAAFDSMISDYGSFDAYLRDGLGIDDVTRQRLRDKFLE